MSKLNFDLNMAGLAGPASNAGLIARPRHGAYRHGLLASAAIGCLAAGPAFAQVCPSPALVNNTQCTVTPGTVITVTPAGAVGLSASGAAGQITGDGFTVNLAAATTTGALAQTGSTITFNGSTLATTATTTANSAGQIGLQATGTGSSVSATGSTVTLGPANGTTVANNLIGVSALSGGAVTLVNTNVTTLGAAGGLNNHALVSDGAVSLIDVTGGTVATRSRASFGALAQNGGSIVLNGTSISTTGVGTAVIAGGHALFATGAGSQITGTNLTLSTTGNFSSPARVENGGAISLTGATITSSATSAADTDPSSGARALSGGQLSLTNSTITMTGQRGTGISVQGAGSIATITDTSASAAGNRANALFVAGGGQANVSGGTLSSAGPTSVLVQDAGSAVTLTNTAIQGVSGPTLIGYGLRVNSGATATMTGGSSTTDGRDSPGIAASGGGSVAATNVRVTTSGNDNAMGVIADLDGTINLTDSVVTTTGGEVRSGARPHALAARNPNGILTATGTTVTTSGLLAMGVVADDGGVATFSQGKVTTSGTSGIGLFSVTEQTGAQFAANLTASDLSIATSGTLAHGVAAQSRNDISAPLALATVNRAVILTTGSNAVGLRAVLGDYGTRPITGRGEARVVANDSQVQTQGAGAHGALSRDNPTSVTMNRTDVVASGLAAHGSVAEAGGLIVGNSASVTATGASSAALFVIGAPDAVSNARYTDSRLANLSGPTIGVAGNGNVSLTNSTAGGSGEWLRVGQSTDFPPLVQSPPLTGVPDLPDADLPPPAALPPLPAAPGLPVVPGLANVTLDNSVVTGWAFTAPGSVSNVTMLNESLWTMTGSSNVTNLVNDPSLIQYTPPVGDPTQLSSYKTLTVVNYVGIGGGIGLNTYLGDDSAPSDRLIIDGGTGTGTSPLFIANTTGPGALTLADGILVVDAQNGATTVPGNFTLGNRVAAGAFEYGLYRGGVSNAESWFLRSRIVPTPPGPDPDPIPDYRNEVPVDIVLPALANRLGLGTLGTYHDRIGDDYPAPVQPVEPIICKAPSKDGGCAVPAAVAAEMQPERAAWGRLFGETGSVDFDATNPAGAVQNFVEHGPSYDFDMYGLQAGMDLLRRLNDDGSRDIAGFYIGVGRITADVDAVLGGPAGTSSVNGYSLGGYWTRIAEKGWFVDAVLQATWYDAEGNAEGRGRFAGENFDTDGWGFAASLEGGYPFDLGNGWSVEPQAQLVYQHVSLDDGSDAFARIDYDATDALYGRLGARLARDWLTESGKRMTAWGKADVWSVFGASATTTFSGPAGGNPVSFDTDIGGTWGSVGLGLQGEVKKNVTMFASGDYNFGLGGDGDFDSWSGRIGMKVKW